MKGNHIDGFFDLLRRHSAQLGLLRSSSLQKRAAASLTSSFFIYIFIYLFIFIFIYFL